MNTQTPDEQWARRQREDIQEVFFERSGIYEANGMSRVKADYLARKDCDDYIREYNERRSPHKRNDHDTTTAHPETTQTHRDT